MLPRLNAVGAGMLLGASILACSDAETTAPRKAVRIPSAVMAANSGIQLRIGSFGDGTKAQWKSGEGLIDAKGSRFQALLLQKATATSTFSASYAIVKGLGSDVLGVGGRIASIVIIFDEGNDVGSGFAFIDNIRVNDKVFTSSSD